MAFVKVCISNKILVVDPGFSVGGDAQLFSFISFCSEKKKQSGVLVMGRHH